MMTIVAVVMVVVMVGGGGGAAAALPHLASGACTNTSSVDGSTTGSVRGASTRLQHDHHPRDIARQQQQATHKSPKPPRERDSGLDEEEAPSRRKLGIVRGPPLAACLDLLATDVKLQVQLLGHDLFSRTCAARDPEQQRRPSVSLSGRRGYPGKPSR